MVHIRIKICKIVVLLIIFLHFEGRAGVPMEVMGLMLGQFVDEYTITCVDVFAMPQVNGYIMITKIAF